MPWSKCEKEWSTEDCFTPDAAVTCISQNASYFKGKCLNSTEITAIGLLIENVTSAIKRPPAEEYFQ